MIKREGDSVFTYQHTSFHYLHDRKMTNRVTKTYLLHFQNNLLRQKGITDSKGNLEVTNFRYFPNGDLRQRIITRIPEPAETIVYTGAPGDDNQSYKYDYDRKGRIKTLYTIVKGKTYKLAAYSYK